MTTSDPNSHVDRNAEGQNKLLEVSEDLYSLAKSLRRIGSFPLADELEFLAATIEEARSTLDGAYSDLLHGSVRASEEATQNMLTVALHMANPEHNRTMDNPTGEAQ